ncbi:helix-turn-helix transcriptional regulator [Dyadobacter chenwenxiniae]|uniref:Helix-turn-helix transcriptional regulator n=1 Tax=Dyadobacter chenwenxiniae TaxID=2906456 RepID=A0A9X1PRF0_9BACT|nr:helix-turn-helix domain-containing protein [Dyadobacter chenwenxiniae]MCF0065551.1 helix-turn-helix transcriptional regulator [Dyadobacter chenwenxiniae]UON85461.1 helix-turn-helix transcriptional regulator [Dyadobacter chenwenxiniae]
MESENDKNEFKSFACSQSLKAIEDVLHVLGGKWKLRIVVGIASGYNRFNELQRAVEGISARVLSNELKDLETNGVIVRKVEAGATPVIVTYEPTEYAKTVMPIVNTLADWGKNHRNKLQNESHL